jgi:hypothetical protein
MYLPSTARHIARWVLVWLAMSLAVAIASPLVNPQTAQIVCSGTGAMKLMVQSDEGSIEWGTLTLDCPLCAQLGAPPPALTWGAEPPFELAFSLLPLETARMASLLRSPCQARAPPALS